MITFESKAYHELVGKIDKIAGYIAKCETSVSIEEKEIWLDSNELAELLKISTRTRIEMLNKKLEKLNNTKNQIDGDTLLDNQDLCLLLKVSNRTLQRYRSSGILPYRRIMQKTYYLESDVHKFISQEFVYKSRK